MLVVRRRAGLYSARIAVYTLRAPSSPSLTHWWLDVEFTLGEDDEEGDGERKEGKERGGGARTGMGNGNGNGNGHGGRKGGVRRLWRDVVFVLADEVGGLIRSSSAASLAALPRASANEAAAGGATADGVSPPSPSIPHVLCDMVRFRGTQGNRGGAGRGGRGSRGGGSASKPRRSSMAQQGTAKQDEQRHKRPTITIPWLARRRGRARRQVVDLEAALVIQCAVRQILAWRRLRLLREKRDAHLAQIESTEQRRKGRDALRDFRYLCASRMAAVYHGHVLRKELRYLAKHATNIQRIYKGRFMRKAVLEMRRRMRDGALVETVYQRGRCVSGRYLFLKVTRSGFNYHFTGYDYEAGEEYRGLVTSQRMALMLQAFPYGVDGSYSRTRRRKLNAWNHPRVLSLLLAKLSLIDPIKGLGELQHCDGTKILIVDPERGNAAGIGGGSGMGAKMKSRPLADQGASKMVTMEMSLRGYVEERRGEPTLRGVLCGGVCGVRECACAHVSMCACARCAVRGAVLSTRVLIPA